MKKFLIVIGGWFSSNKHLVAKNLATKFNCCYFSEKKLVFSFLKFADQNFSDLDLKIVDLKLKKIIIDADSNFIINEKKIVLEKNDYIIYEEKGIDYPAIGEKYLNSNLFPNLYHQTVKILHNFGKLIYVGYFLISKIQKKMIIFFLKTNLSNRCNLYISKNNLHDGSIIGYSKYVNAIDEYLSKNSSFFEFYYHQKKIEIFNLDFNDFSKIDLIVNNIYHNVCK